MALGMVAGGFQVMAASTTTLRYPSYMNNDLILGCAFRRLDEILEYRLADGCLSPTREMLQFPRYL